eukprot:2011636-Rhodomonas_salina.3
MHLADLQLSQDKLQARHRELRRLHLAHHLGRPHLEDLQLSRAHFALAPLPDHQQRHAPTLSERRWHPAVLERHQRAVRREVQPLVRRLLALLAEPMHVDPAQIHAHAPDVGPQRREHHGMQGRALGHHVLDPPDPALVSGHRTPHVEAAFTMLEPPMKILAGFISGGSGTTSVIAGARPLVPTSHAHISVGH